MKGLLLFTYFGFNDVVRCRRHSHYDSQHITLDHCLCCPYKRQMENLPGDIRKFNLISFFFFGIYRTKSNEVDVESCISWYIDKIGRKEKFFL